MKKKLVCVLIHICLVTVGLGQTDKYPLGSFVDDYGIQYDISKELWFQKPGNKYDVVKWDSEKMFLIAKNRKDNVAHGGLWTRIDWMPLNDMKPYTWAFCITEYKAKTHADAEKNETADRKNPMKGCNGFPFSRLKKVNK